MLQEEELDIFGIYVKIYRHVYEHIYFLAVLFVKKASDLLCKLE